MDDQHATSAAPDDDQTWRDELHENLDRTFAPTEPVNGVVVVEGYGCRIAVEKGQLVVSDGLGRHRRERRFLRSGRNLRRLVVLGHAGTISIEALRWLDGTGTAMVVLDSDGRVLLGPASPAIDDARLRRSQAIAGGTEAGVAVTRYLLARKIEGQADVLLMLDGDLPGVCGYVPTLKGAAESLTAALTVDECRQVEAVAAAIYWRAWERMSVRFAARDLSRVPDAWRTVGGRRSSLGGGSPRKAERPVQAIWNYTYRLAEAEARIAALAVGLDPGLGWLHLDVRGRDSAALDLLETVRPHVDAYVLRLLRSRTFRRGDFTELPDGTVRVLAPLTHELAATLATWRAAVAPAAEAVAHILARAATGNVPRPTPLTATNHRHRQGKAVAPLRLPGIAPTCKRCGAPLAQARATYCTPCWPKVRSELAGVASRRSAAMMRGNSPSSETRAKRSVSVSRGKAAKRALSIPVGWSDERFRTEVMTRLDRFDLDDIMGVTGLARSSSSAIRAGDRVPAPKHWPALAALVNTSE